MKRGFTLIELLAVIVILAIIALIATPVVLNIINDSKESSEELSVKAFIDSTNNKIASEMLRGVLIQDGEYEITNSGNICLSELAQDGSCFNELVLSYEGKKAESGYVVIKNRKLKYIEYVKLGEYAYTGPKDKLQKVKFDKATRITPSIYFTFDESRGMITDFDATSTSDIVIPSFINGKEVTTIGIAAFSDKNLTSVIIPYSITNIEAVAFDSNELKSITIPGSVKEIGNYAFHYNDLEEVTILDGVTNIGSSAFEGNNIKILNLPSSLREIEDRAFINNELENLVIPNGVTNIGEDAFSRGKLTRISIPSSVETIKSFAFRCNPLTTVIIGDSINGSNIVSIGYAAFDPRVNDYNYNDLESVTIYAASSDVSVNSSAFGQNPPTILWQPVTGS